MSNRIDFASSICTVGDVAQGDVVSVFFSRSIDNRSKKVIAMKIIDLEEAEDEIEDIQQEIAVLSQCDSPHVTRYYGSYLKVSSLPPSLPLSLSLSLSTKDFYRNS